jgi:transposase
MAVVQLRNPTEGRSYFDAKKAAGKTSMESMRALKRRLSNLIYTKLVDDQTNREVASPGGQQGNVSDSSATGSHPRTGSSEKPLPEPARTQPKPALPKVS